MELDAARWVFQQLEAAPDLARVNELCGTASKGVSGLTGRELQVLRLIATGKSNRAITAEAPRELAVWLVLLQAPPAPFVPEEWHGRRICSMVVCYSGDPAHAGKAVAPIRALRDPVLDLLHQQPYLQLQSFLDDTEPKGSHYYWRTEYTAELSDGLLSAVRDLFSTCPIPGGEIGFLHLAGALNERAEDDGAVGNRNARFVMARTP
jgi:hypothetical protein